MRYFWILFLLISQFGYSQDHVKVELSSPRSTVYSHLYFLMPENYNPDQAAKTFYGLSEKEAVQKAIKLKQIYDGKGLFIDIKKIPSDENFVDTLLNPLKSLAKTKYRFTPFPKELPEVYVEKRGKHWYYAKETADRLESIYQDVFPWHLNWIQDQFPELKTYTIFSVEAWKIIGSIILIIFSVLVYLLIRPIFKFTIKKLHQLLIPSSERVDNQVVKRFVRSASMLVVLYIVLKILPSLQLLKINVALILALRLAVTIFWIFIGLHFVESIMVIYNRRSNRTHSKLDEQLAPILRKLLFGLAYFLGFLKMLTLFGVDATTVLAGASIGGLAVAFAAQDSVKNLIGTVVIFLDKPFHIGDWVEIGAAIGTVENVGLRSTRIRAADTSVYQIPNSKIAEADINNKGMRIYRRYTTQLGIRYDTPPELIEAFVKGIRELIRVHPETREESYNVEFTGFGDSSLLILVNVYFKQLDWGAEQSSKHKLHIGILKLAAAMGVEFAFPSTTMMVEQFPNVDSDSPDYITNQAKIETKVNEVIDKFKEANE